MERIIIRSSTGESRSVVLPEDKDEFSIVISDGSEVDLRTLVVIDSIAVGGGVYLRLESGLILHLQPGAVTDGKVNQALDLDEEVALQDILAGNILPTAAGSPNFTIVYGDQNTEDTSFYVSRDALVTNDTHESLHEITSFANAKGIDASSVLPEDFSRAFLESSSSSGFFLNRQIITPPETPPPVAPLAERAAPILESVVIDGRELTLGFAVLPDSGGEYRVQGLDDPTFLSTKDIAFLANEGGLDKNFTIQLVYRDVSTPSGWRETLDGNIIKSDVDIEMAYVSLAFDLSSLGGNIPAPPVGNPSEIKLILGQAIPANAELIIQYNADGPSRLVESSTTYTDSGGEVISVYADTVEFTPVTSFVLDPTSSQITSADANRSILFETGTSGSLVPVLQSVSIQNLSTTQIELSTLGLNSMNENERPDTASGIVVSGFSMNNGAGANVTRLGDINGDGVDDYSIGTQNESYNALVVFGNSDPFAPESIDLSLVSQGEGGFVVVDGGETAVARQMFNAGDINGDGLSDILVGSSRTTESYVIFGGSDTDAMLLLGGIDGRRVGLDQTATISVIIDGELQELLVYADSQGNPLDIEGELIAPMPQEFTTPETGEILTADFAAEDVVDVQQFSGVDISSLNGNNGFAMTDSSNREALSVTAAGDTNGDGKADLLLSRRSGDRTSLSLLFGAEGDSAAQVDLGDASSRLVLELGYYDHSESDFSTIDVMTLGDVNGDGTVDFLVTPSNVGASSVSSAFVLYGDLQQGSVDLSGLISGNSDASVSPFGFQITGIENIDSVTFGVAGDVNGDGLSDILLGSPGENFAAVILGDQERESIDLDALENGDGGFVVSGPLITTQFDTGEVEFLTVQVGVSDDGERIVEFVEEYVRDGQGDLVMQRNSDGVDVAVMQRVEVPVLETIDARKDTGLGTSISGAGDINGDGLDDILVGAPRANFDLLASSGTIGAFDFLMALDRSINQSFLDVGLLIALDSINESIAALNESSDLGLSLLESPLVVMNIIDGEHVLTDADGVPKVDEEGNPVIEQRITIPDLDFFDWMFSDEVTELFSLLHSLEISGHQASIQQYQQAYLEALDLDTGVLDPAVVLPEIKVVDESWITLVNGLETLKQDMLKGHTGETYVVYGQAHPENVDVSQLDSSVNGFAIAGANIGVDTAIDVEVLGDINGDGFDDLAIGAPGTGVGGVGQAGAAYVLFGDDYSSETAFVGSVVDDSYQGTSAAEVILGGLGDDSLSGGGGADMIKGGLGDDRLFIADEFFSVITGGHGFDTLILEDDFDLDFTSLGNISPNQVGGFEAIEMAGENTIALGIEDVLDLSGGIEPLMLIGGQEDKLLLHNLAPGELEKEALSNLLSGSWPQGETNQDVEIWDYHSANEASSPVLASVSVSVEVDVSVVPSVV